MNPIARARFYLATTGVLGLCRAIVAKATNSHTLLRVDHADCRFPFMLRFPSSDFRTFEQIFASDAYDFEVTSPPEIIVDAGANVGLASIYFANKYPRAKVIAIEPEQSNFELLVKNVAPYPNVMPLRAALWHENKEIDLVDPGRGKWGFMTQNPADDRSPAETRYGAVCHRVTAVTVDWLLENYSLESIDILKIDIEGAEKEVFGNAQSWIGRVESVIIELHDSIRPGCSASFYHGATGFAGEWLQHENVILTKGNCLKKNDAQSL